MTTKRQQRIIEHFRRSIDSYDSGAKVQKVVGESLVAKIAGYDDICYEKVLEVGCCTGSMTETLCRTRSVGELWVNDLVPECCRQAAERVKGVTGKICPLAGDIETVPLPADLDLIISSSTFQWLKDLPNTFQRFSVSLRECGYLAFTMFGPGTMNQVRELTGVGLDYISENRLTQMLQKNFQVIEVESSRFTLLFKTPKEVLYHIQNTGVGGAGNYRWTPGKFRSFDQEYRQKFGTGEGVPVDYVSICVIARKIEER